MGREAVTHPVRGNMRNASSPRPLAYYLPRFAFWLVPCRCDQRTDSPMAHWSIPSVGAHRANKKPFINGAPGEIRTPDPDPLAAIKSTAVMTPRIRLSYLV